MQAMKTFFQKILRFARWYRKVTRTPLTEEEKADSQTFGF